MPMSLTHVVPMLTKLLKSRWLYAIVALIGTVGLIEATVPGQFDEILYYDQNRQEVENQTARRDDYDKAFAQHNVQIALRIQVLDELIAEQHDLAEATSQLQKLYGEIPNGIRGVCRNYPATQVNESVSLYILDCINARLNRSPNRNDVMQWLHRQYESLYGRRAQIAQVEEIGDPASGT